VRHRAFRANGDSKTRFVCPRQDFGPLNTLGLHDGSAPFLVLPQLPVHSAVYLHA
jgi:predicted neutral ceramidase superfamily lipid hydrolase